MKILLISFCGLIAGAAGICAVISGPASILFAPLLAVFGWFYLVPIYLLVALMWGLYRDRLAAMPWRLLFILFGPALGGGLMALQGAHFTSARDLPMHDGMVLGGLLAGGVSTLMITLIKTQPTDPGASRNGGPASPLGNSGVTSGPRSLS